MPENANRKYRSISIEEELAEQIKAWQLAFGFVYGEKYTASDVIRQSLDFIQDTKPALYQAYCQILMTNLKK